MVEGQKVAPSPRKRNGGKLPQIFKGGMAENCPRSKKSGMAMIESHISKTCRIRINDNTER